MIGQDHFLMSHIISKKLSVNKSPRTSFVKYETLLQNSKLMLGFRLKIAFSTSILLSNYIK